MPFFKKIQSIVCT